MFFFADGFDRPVGCPAEMRMGLKLPQDERECVGLVEHDVRVHDAKKTGLARGELVDEAVPGVVTSRRRDATTPGTASSTSSPRARPVFFASWTRTSCSTNPTHSRSSCGSFRPIRISAGHPTGRSKPSAKKNIL